MRLQQLRSFIMKKLLPFCTAAALFCGNIQAQETDFGIQATVNGEPVQVKVYDFEENEKNQKIKDTIISGSAEDLKKLLAEGHDVNKDYNCGSMLNTAIQSLANPDVASIQNLHASEKVKMLIEAGADVNMEACGQTPLTAALALPVQLQIMQAFGGMFSGMMSNAKEGNCCIDGDCKPCAEVSDAEKKQIERQLDDGFGAMRRQIDSNLMEILNLLIDNGADVNQAVSGSTPLMTAAMAPQDGSSEPLKLLLARGANPNIRDNSGNTALFWAYFSGNNQAIELLKAAGADTSVRNNKGQLYNEFKKISASIEINAETTDAGDGKQRHKAARPSAETSNSGEKTYVAQRKPRRTTFHR